MKKLHIYLLLLLGLLVSSCNDWLDVKPRTQVRNDEMYDSYKGFKDALTACYIKMNDRKLYGIMSLYRRMLYYKIFGITDK